MIKNVYCRKWKFECLAIFTELTDIDIKACLYSTVKCFYLKTTVETADQRLVLSINVSGILLIVEQEILVQDIVPVLKGLP